MRDLCEARRNFRLQRNIRDINSRSALPGPPNTFYWAMMATVLKHRRNGSVVELVRVRMDEWTLVFKELAEWFGMELSRMIVDFALTVSTAQ